MEFWMILDKFPNDFINPVKLKPEFLIASSYSLDELIQKYPHYKYFGKCKLNDERQLGYIISNLVDGNTIDVNIDVIETYQRNHPE